MVSQTSPKTKELKAEVMPLSSLPQGDMLSRVGSLTRALHDNLSGLGLDQALSEVASEIPDAKDRLNYVARMTEQAAERVLNATDEANPLQDEIATDAAALKDRWKATLAASSVKSEYNQVAEDTIKFLTMADKNTAATKALLMDIMMAQDFQDLTGQVITKINALAQEIEKQLVQVLVDFSPEAPQEEKEVTLMNGPQIDKTKVDVVSNQGQVDDLLDSLGF